MRKLLAVTLSIVFCNISYSNELSNWYFKANTGKVSSESEIFNSKFRNLVDPYFFGNLGPGIEVTQETLSSDQSDSGYTFSFGRSFSWFDLESSYTNSGIFRSNFIRSFNFNDGAEFGNSKSFREVKTKILEITISKSLSFTKDFYLAPAISVTRWNSEINTEILQTNVDGGGNSNLWNLSDTDAGINYGFGVDAGYSIGKKISVEFVVRRYQIGDETYDIYKVGGKFYFGG